MNWKRMEEGKEVLKVNQVGDIVYLTYPVLEKQPWLSHCFSTRLGGVSTGDYTSMSFRQDVGDTEENVRENYRRIASVLGADVNQFVRAKLVHGNQVHLVSEAECGEGVVRPTSLIGYDGLMTNISGVTLVATFADCVPLYFVDPVHRAIALSHSGWRGTVTRIGKKTVEGMEQAFGTKPEDILACIGPCICADCYEVGEDVAGAFCEEFSGENFDRILKRKENGKYLLDLRKANERIFLEAGILPEHIAIADFCTACNKDYLFSHRATNGKRGNLAAFLGIL